MHKINLLRARTHGTLCIFRLGPPSWQNLKYPLMELSCSRPTEHFSMPCAFCYENKWWLWWMVWRFLSIVSLPEWYMDTASSKEGWQWQKHFNKTDKLINLLNSSSQFKCNRFCMINWFPMLPSIYPFVFYIWIVLLKVLINWNKKLSKSFTWLRKFCNIKSHRLNHVTLN